MKAPAASSTMAHLVDRVRLLLEGDPRISEKNMFGGLTFLLNGHILVGCKKDGRILLSVGKAHNDDALARPGATQMVHRDRPMTGFVWVEPDAIEDDDDLADWVRTAERWVSQMPIEPAKPARRAGAMPPAKSPARSRRAKA
jgi:TfoX/Sxy family transcriptional regulator of competence genes